MCAIQLPNFESAQGLNLASKNLPPCPPRQHCDCNTVATKESVHGCSVHGCSAGIAERCLCSSALFHSVEHVHVCVICNLRVRDPLNTNTKLRLRSVYSQQVLYDLQDLLQPGGWIDLEPQQESLWMRKRLHHQHCAKLCLLRACVFHLNQLFLELHTGHRAPSEDRVKRRA